MTEQKSSTTWKRCGVCKRDLGFESDYFECSVSTCNTGRNPSVFCSVNCWQQHVPVMRHRDAWADEKRSPTRAQWESEAEGAVPRRIVVDARTQPQAPPASAIPQDILIVASKLKAYIRARAGMNTSESAMDALSDVVREAADRAIEQARADGRKTVMDRDFQPR
jgi:hypothetical protein